MYILPSIRFLLTVHDLPQTHLTKLDTMSDQFLKKWAGLPRCATNAILQDLAELYYGGWLWGTYSSDFNVPIIQISRFLDMMDSKHNKTNVQAYFLHFLCFRGDLRNLKIVNFKRQLEKGLKNDLTMTCGPNKISHPLQKCLNYSL